MTMEPFSNPVALDFVDRLRASARGNRIAWGPELTPFIRECGAMSGVIAADTAVALFRSAADIIADLTAKRGPPPWNIHPYDFATHAAAVSDFGALLLKRKNPSLTVVHIRELLDQSVRVGDVSDGFTPHIHALLTVVRSRWSELSDCPDVRASLTQLAAFARRLERKPRAFRYSGGKSGDFALGPSGKERLELLQALMPRLRIAPACTITDPFLVVLGKKRAYKIHIGSGKTLLPPSDRLLNIGPPRRALSKRDQNSVFLPFEGDQTLSVILSKAILLAEDDKITDPDILRQIDAP